MARKKKADPTDIAPAAHQTGAEEVGELPNGDGPAEQPRPTAEFAAESRERKKRQGYDNVGTTDFLAGVRILEHQDPYLSIIRFQEPESSRVTKFMAAAGFEKNDELEARGTHEWSRPIRYDTRNQDRVDADRVFEKVCTIVRDEKGITHAHG